MALVLAALLLAATLRALSPAFAATPILAIDTDPSGNTATHADVINSCVAVSTGETFQVDIVIKDVEELLAWEIYFQYDPAILSVIASDVRLFQNANPGSSIYDLSQQVPNTSGSHRLTAADTSDPPTPDSGSGVLARLTLEAVGAGVSAVSIDKEDIDGDGRPDRGPFLRNVDGHPIGDSDGDSLFDGPVENGQIAVDAACPPGSNVGRVFERASDGSGLPSVYVLAPGVAAAIAALAGLGALALLARRARRAEHFGD